jgi:hypothetical protein
MPCSAAVLFSIFTSSSSTDVCGFYPLSLTVYCTQWVEREVASDTLAYKPQCKGTINCGTKLNTPPTSEKCG